MKGRRFQYACARVARLIADERGQDLIEYALLTGIIAIAGVLVFPQVRTKMANAYAAWNSNAQTLMQTTPPPM
jgi:Flp pilus assembly pilin Flp